MKKNKKSSSGSRVQRGAERGGLEGGCQLLGRWWVDGAVSDKLSGTASAVDVTMCSQRRCAARTARSHRVQLSLGLVKRSRIWQ